MYTLAGSAHAAGAPHGIDLQRPPAVAYWCRQFKTTPERLFAAVKTVGSNPSVVRKRLLEKAQA
jgi:hypothetical protein